jgi:hypothetical protein
MALHEAPYEAGEDATLTSDSSLLEHEIFSGGDDTTYKTDIVLTPVPKLTWPAR